jgi:hypothetical protein
MMASGRLCCFKTWQKCQSATVLRFKKESSIVGVQLYREAKLLQRSLSTVRVSFTLKCELNVKHGREGRELFFNLTFWHQSFTFNSNKSPT